MESWLIFQHRLLFRWSDGVNRASRLMDCLFGRVGGLVGKSASRYSETLEEVRRLRQTNLLEGLPRKTSKARQELSVP